MHRFYLGLGNLHYIFYFAVRLLIISGFFIYNFDSHASRLKERDYFASLRSSKTNVRFGPGMNYDIKYILRLKSMPIKVIAEYDNWVEITDFEGEEGWINKNLITKRKTAMTRSNRDVVNLYKSDFTKSKIMAKLENNITLDVLRCKKAWCYIEIFDYKGWLKKSEIWGWKGR